ncbi:MAG TPA: Druantia anti-phage system protein DruA [Verrucomicrobiae bacterium]|nr:Druantia anti-phage system protein DruA [Verrucomicrobiae bacterium]
MDTEIELQGRRISGVEMRWLCGWIEEHPQWSRKRLARELCQRWQWMDGQGRLKDFAARSLLIKLERRGVVKLPPLRLYNRRPPRGAPTWESWEEPVVWEGSLAEISPIRIEPVAPGTEAHRRWGFYLHRYHYLGLAVVGENMGYLARDAQGREVACLLFGAAAWRCAPRDRALGWSSHTRKEGLARVVNNTRFLVLPWVRVKHLASCVLGQVARRIEQDWEQKYGHGLDWLETFVDRERFRGSCYRAANWQCVGQTQGRSRQDRDHQLRVPVKDVYLYALKGRRNR